MNTVSDSRKQFERDYYNKMYENSLANGKNIAWKYGSASMEISLQAPYKYIEKRLLADIRNKRVLDFCCGAGEFSIFPALNGAFVHGMDISDISIEKARARAEYFGVSDRTSFGVMDAENLDYPDNSFDIILSYGSLSYLELDKAYAELQRVLKKDGLLIVVDTLGHNPLFNLNRKKYVKSGVRQKYHYDHIMTINRIYHAKNYFGKISVKYFDLFTSIAYLLEKYHVSSILLPFLRFFDVIILSLPSFNKLALKFVSVMSEPNK